MSRGACGQHGDSWMTADKTYFTSESVTEGIRTRSAIRFLMPSSMRCSRAIRKRLACETATTTGMVLVFGEISTTTYVDIPATRETIEKIGYTHLMALMPDVRRHRGDQRTEPGDFRRHRGLPSRSAGQHRSVRSGRRRDQGHDKDRLCYDETELMPLPISLAHRLCRRLAEARKSGEIPWLLPDGKAQVTVEYHRGKPARIDLVVVSAARERHFERGDRADDNRAASFVIPATRVVSTDLFINPSRRFEIGGPMADAGLTGRKIIVDTYGGMARHGGGAFSGKDATKVDRPVRAAYAARYGQEYCCCRSCQPLRFKCHMQ